MFVLDGVLSSFQTILSHKFRSFLTLLGILIGITSVVAMFSSVSGFQMIVTENIEKMGWDNTLVVSASSQSNTQIRGFGQTIIYRTAHRRALSLTYQDFESLKAELDVKYIYGMIDSWERSQTRRNWYRVRATNEDFFHNQTYPLKEGRFFNAFEMSRGMKVCIVGPTFSKDHFNDEDPLDQYFTAGNHRYKIIGILDEDVLNKGNNMGFNPWGRRWDLQAIYIPLKTGAIYYRRNMSLDYITIQAHGLESYADVKNRSTQILLANRNMQRDFSFQDVGAEILEITQQLNEMISKWSLALVSIATISLLVGGIGLFSTLLISINERMSEIGIRKSVGAKDRDIFFYFIIEAITLSIIASIFGIILGLLVTYVLGMAINMPVPVSMASIYIGLAFSLVIGFLSGLYPAIKAAKINPIQAIYYFE